MSTIAEELLKLNTAKTNLSTVIESYGGEVPDLFANYGSAISSLINQRDSIPHSSIVSPDSSTIVSANNDGTGTIILLSGDSEIVKTIASTDQIPNISPLATKSAVNAAIGTINSNFTNLKNAINGNNNIAYLTKNTLTSGWSIYDGDNGTANRVRMYHYGKFAYLYGTAKCTSALNANQTYTIGTLNIPSGYALIGAIAGGGGPDIIWSITAAGVLSVRSLIARTANTNLGIRLPGLYLSTFPAAAAIDTIGNI